MNVKVWLFVSKFNICIEVYHLERIAKSAEKSDFPADYIEN